MKNKPPHSQKAIDTVEFANFPLSLITINSLYVLLRNKATFLFQAYTSTPSRVGVKIECYWIKWWILGFYVFWSDFLRKVALKSATKIVKLSKISSFSLVSWICLIKIMGVSMKFIFNSKLSICREV